MNVAIVLAGGTGTRVGANVPKQFIEVLGKPVLAYTLEVFQANPNIDAIEVVCHRDWVGKAEEIVSEYGIDKVRWICLGGTTFQESTYNGVVNLRNELASDDIAVITFGAGPMIPHEDIDDSIRVCELHGNGISSADMSLCTCIKDDEESTTQNIIRETLKGFAAPWTFRYGELLEAYDTAVERGILDELEPHTTSLYLALGKRLWFSKCTTSQVKITQKSDLDLFEGYLLLQEKRRREAACGNAGIEA
ncbi:MAG: 2-C-methyl-D-erythritol 4-phosphate cytidylyltransferase [Coriobacteriaceae bacterium]|nr:2-C-methyl-D-erythritol 4-phosphate cytidylyltransferase [Coriobacteriaceae bacterium]